jgi:hypothetical protein
LSNYTKNTNFTAKDALITGDPNKKILGSLFDSEFDEIATAIASKEDSANKNQNSGYAGLDSGGDVLPANLPAATESAQGAVELATTTEANTGTDTARAVTPAGLKYSVDNYAAGLFPLKNGSGASGTWTINVTGNSGTVTSEEQTANGNFAIGLALAPASSALGYIASSFTANPVTGLLIAPTFQGSGASLTSLNATNISSGTLDTARLPATINVATDVQINSVPIFASGTFTITMTGCTTSPTGTATWARAGSIVTLVLPVITGISNATTFTLTGLPAGIQPATVADQYQRLAICVDNGANVDAIIRVQAGSGTLTLNKASLAAFTNSGTKGLSAESAITYLLI